MDHFRMLQKRFTKVLVGLFCLKKLISVMAGRLPSDNFSVRLFKELNELGYFGLCWYLHSK